MSSLQETGLTLFVIAIFVALFFRLYSIDKARDSEFMQVCTPRFSVAECKFMVELNGRERANYLILKEVPNAD